MILAPILEQHGVKIEARSGPKKQTLFDRFFDQFWIFLASKNDVPFHRGDPPFSHQSRSPARSGRFWPHLGPLVPILAPFWPFRDTLLAPSRPSCTDFGHMLAVLGPLVGDSGDMFDAVLGSCASFSDCVFGPTLGPEAETTPNSQRHKPRARHGGGHRGGSRTWI